jgi:hypothetical protein
VNPETVEHLIFRAELDARGNQRAHAVEDPTTDIDPLTRHGRRTRFYPGFEELVRCRCRLGSGQVAHW